MDRVADLTTVIRQQVKDYAVPTYKAKTYYVGDEQQHIYMVIIVPNDNYPIPASVGVTVMVRIVDEYVVIDQDITDRPLFEALVSAGIPREQIVLAYAGETQPVEKDKTE